MCKREIDVEIGSGNVFKDLRLRNPEELLAKANLARRIIDVVESRKLTHVEQARS